MAVDIQMYLNKFFDNYGFANCKIGVALSGGRDSVALAHALKMGGYNVVAINVEHGIRGQSSIDDSRFCADFCQKYDIELHSFSVDVPTFCVEHGLTIEQGARECRYDIFAKAVESGICDCIALAHHQDDQAETVLMRILRGTGVAGIVGMRAVRDIYIRPLLDCTRDEIDEYIKQNSLEYVDDESNFETDFTRNFIRKELLGIKQRFPKVASSIARLAQNAQEEEEFVAKYIPNPIVDGDEARIAIEDISNTFKGKRLIKKAIEALGVTQDIESRHYPLIFELATSQNGKKIDLTHGICVHKQGDFLVFTHDRSLSRDDVCHPFSLGDFGDFEIAQSSYDEFVASKGAKGVLFVDGQRLKQESVVIRHRQNGDVIQKFGGGTKSVGDFLTDKKLPLRKRDELWMIANNSEVLVIVGVEISSSVMVSQDSKCILKIIAK